MALSIRVLLADDDQDFLDVTAYALNRAGFAVSTVSNGKAALDTWRSERPDIVLLDMAMPHMAGTEVCQEIRRTSTTPIVLISGQKRESDVIRGFDLGADDYMTKPFSVQHLVRRLRALHGRVAGQVTDLIPKHLVVEPLVIDLDSFSVQVERRAVQLTRLEFRLLYYLAANVNRVVATSRLIDFGWGMDGEADASLLKTHFSHIRRKLREVSDWPIEIRAFPGLGYSLHIEAPQNSLN